MLIVMSVKLTLADELLKVNSALKLIFSVIEDQCVISRPLNFTKGFCSSAGNIYPNISEPIVYQPKLERENKKY